MISRHAAPNGPARPDGRSPEDLAGVILVPSRRHNCLMPGSFKTEGIVLRSIRYGEADRILHLYTAERGRVNAIAKGSRRPKSRFGGRLEPFFRLDLLLHEGRSDLCTVTGASTLDGYPGLRSDGPGLDAAARACDAVLRLLDSVEPNRPAYNLLCRYLALLDEDASGDGAPSRPPRRRARLPAEARAGGRLLARARLLRPLRGARGDRRLLRVLRRRRLQLLRGRRLPALPRCARVHGRRARPPDRRAAGGAGAGAAAGRARDLGDAGASRSRASALGGLKPAT